MKIIITLLILMGTVLSYPQNNFPVIGDVKIENAALLLETNIWKPSLISLKDTHYNPQQIYHFQIEGNGLKIRQDENVNYQFMSGGNFIVNNGNVGIGTTNPLYKLVTTSGVQLRKTTIGVTTGTAENSFIRDEWLTGAYGPANWDQGIQRWVRPGGLYNDIGGIVYQDEGTYFLRDRAGTQLEYTNTEFLQTAFMFSSIATGNIGIGTITPDSKLTVKGTVHAEEVRVDLSVPAPDYVFKEGYELLSLEDTQKYIKEHGHLPNIPSAEEMEAEGVKLGVMNMKLLEKIEELTLYIIELKKEVNQIRKEK